MPDTPISVELEQAWSWVCPACQQRNYTRGHACKDPKILAEAREELGPGDIVLSPEQVFCCKCETRFPVKVPSDD